MCRGLNNITREPLLGVEAEGENACHGGLFVGVHDPGPTKKFAVLVEAAKPEGVALTDGIQVRVDNFVVQVVKSGVIYRRTIEEGRLPSRRLDLNVGGVSASGT